MNVKRKGGWKGKNYRNQRREDCYRENSRDAKQWHEDKDQGIEKRQV